MSCICKLHKMLCIKIKQEVVGFNLKTSHHVHICILLLTIFGLFIIAFVITHHLFYMCFYLHPMDINVVAGF